jgi:hypothetical protein
MLRRTLGKILAAAPFFRFAKPAKFVSPTSTWTTLSEKCPIAQKLCDLVNEEMEFERLYNLSQELEIAGKPNLIDSRLKEGSEFKSSNRIDWLEDFKGVDGHEKALNDMMIKSVARNICYVLEFGNTDIEKNTTPLSDYCLLSAMDGFVKTGKPDATFGIGKVKTNLEDDFVDGCVIHRMDFTLAYLNK